MKKKGSQFVCQECGAITQKWLGKCPECNNWNTLVEESVVARETGTWTGITQSHPVPFDTEDQTVDFPRTLTDIPELDRVLGGGIVRR